MRARGILLALSLLVLPAMAVQAQGRSHVIVLGGGARPADAKRAIAKLRKMTVLPLTPGPGYPKVLKSDTVPGLNPSFHLAVFGFCQDEDAASAVRDMLNLRLDGVYTKRVDQDHPPAACPPTPVGGPAEPDGLTHEHTERLKSSQAWPVWKVYGGPGGPAGGNCTQALVRVQGRGGMLAQLGFTPDDCSPPGEGTMDEFWSLARFLEHDGRSFALLEHRQDWHDNGAVEYKLLAYGCARIQAVATLQPSMPHPQPEVLLRGRTWRELTVIMTQGEETDTQRFRWDERQCAFVPR